MKKNNKTMKNTEIFMPDVVVDLTDPNLTTEEAIAKAEELRQITMPWYKRLKIRLKKIFKK